MLSRNIFTVFHASAAARHNLIDALEDIFTKGFGVTSFLEGFQ